MVDLLVLILASAAVWVAAVRVARRLRRAADAGLDHALTVALLLLVAVLVVSFTVGSAGFYRPFPLALAAVVLALVSVWLTRDPPAVGGAEAGEGEPGRRRRLLGTSLSLPRLVRREPLAVAAVALAATAVLNRALMAVSLRPREFDELAYHLVFVADWVQRGAIGGSDLQRAGCCAWYPVNAEIVYGWLAVFVHSDRLVGLAQIGFLVLGGLATASVARSVGAPDRYAVVAGALFVLTPTALRQSDTNQVDVALAACVLLTLAFMLRIVTPQESASRADVVRFALAASLTLGIKATAIPYVAVACGVLGLHTLLARRRAATPASWRPVLQAGALVLALALVGSGWYVRSWAATGNPFWPFHVELRGHVVFAGRVDPAEANRAPPSFSALPRPLQAPRSWLEDLDVSGDLRRDPHGTNPALGLGLVWLLVGIPSAVAALAMSLRRRDVRFAVFAVSIAPVALFATPDAWMSRFVIPIVAVGLVGFAYVAGRLAPFLAGALTAGAIGLGAVGFVETRPLSEWDKIRKTPLQRPAVRPDGRRYRALFSLPPHERVGVVTGSRLLPYLVIGNEFERTVVALRERPESADELVRFLDENDLEYVVTRVPLPPRVLEGAEVALVARSSGAVVYRRVGGAGGGHGAGLPSSEEPSRSYPSRSHGDARLAGP